LTVGALAAVALPAVLWSAAPASAAATPKQQVSCTGDACTGQRPELTGCDKDGQTVRTAR